MNVTGVEDVPDRPLRVHVCKEQARPLCAGCGGKVWAHGTRQVELVDMSAFGRSVRLVWHKRRWKCPNSGCEVNQVH